MEKLEIMAEERDHLRKELHDLKKCQVNYTKLTVATTGVMIGALRMVGGISGGNIPNEVFLAPLLIILPCWTIFLDKATTITRIVGYVRVLEVLMIAHPKNSDKYIGWENSLSKFRKDKQSNSGKHWLRVIAEQTITGCELFFTQQPHLHLYWYINCITYFFMGLVSLVLGFSGVGIVWILSYLFFYFTTIFNLGVLGNLVVGDYSYDRNEEAWGKILGILTL